MAKKDSRTHGIARYHHMDQDTDSGAQLKSIYADWADSYDDDNDNKLGTVSQPQTVALLSRYFDNRDGRILDVGCGTGLVGQHLAKAGYRHFDGADISTDMMRFAEARGYENLFLLKDGAPLPVEDNSYGATLCVGVFTHGHIGPEGLAEILRVTRPGGVICFTVNEGVWDSGGFESAIARHCEIGDWHVLEQEKRDYMTNENVRGWYVATRKCG